MEKLEVLSPVGSFNNLKLAINCGANAVYFGVKSFNARAKADNIDVDDLIKFVNIAHLHGVKAYMTLNILIKTEEFESVIDVVDRAIEAHVDAFIVQDIGLATYLLNYYEGIELHASTQMGIHNLAGAKFLEELGFKRVVLSRETKLKDIVEIKKNTNLEIEYFVQGALCVAFSGNCYFSSLCFNESGNRGKCLQPCRMKYEALLGENKVKEGYLISPKDLCLIKQMDELIQAGVTSFKIEGRLRREAYLQQATISYVNALNRNTNIEDEIKKLKKVFSRGDYNYGYYLNGSSNIIDAYNSNHKGEKIGVVKGYSVFKDLYKIEIKCNRILNQNDGIKIINGSQELSLGVGNVDLLPNGNCVIYTKHKPIYGDVYLAVDSEFEKSLECEDKKVLIDLDVTAKENQSIKIAINCKGENYYFESDFVCEKAKNSPLSDKDFVEVFNRIKDTEFKIENIKIDLDNIFIPKSILTKFKNIVLEKLEKCVLENVNKYIKIYKKQGVCDNKYESCDSFDRITNAYVCDKKILKNDKNTIIFSPEFYNLQIVKKFANEINEMFYLNLPIVATGDEVKIIDEIINYFGTEKIGVVANNYWALKYIKEGYRVIAGTGLNIVNNYSKNYYYSIGAYNFIRSIEQSLTSSLQGGLSYEGYPVLMTWCHCPYKVSCNSSCDNCKYNNSLTYKLNDGKLFKIRRYKIINCYFELVSTKKITSSSKHRVVDERY